MSNSSQQNNFNASANDGLDQKNNNDRPDLDEIKLVVKDDEQFYTNDNQALQTHNDNSQSASGLINSNTDSTICNSATGHNLNSSVTLNNNTNNVNLNDQTSENLPPAYSEVPGTVPFGTYNGPPPSYDEVINPNAPPTYQSLFGQVQQARKNAKTLPDLIRKLIIILLGTIGLAILISFTILIPFTMIIVGGSNLDNCNAEKIPLFLLIGGITWLTKNLTNFFSQCSVRRNRSATTNSSNNNNSSTANNSSNPCASRYSSNSCQAESNPCASSSSTSNNCNTNRSSRCVINLENEHSISESQQNKTRRRDFLINCFITAWFLTGCIMVYRIYPPNYTDPTHPNYCNKTVYFYAFWLLTSTFCIFALFIGCICCVSITAIFSNTSEIRI